MATATNQRLDYIIFGAGGRGNGFGHWVKDHPEYGRVVAIAEPDEGRRNVLADACGVADDMRFDRWQDVVAKPKFADVIINTTMDQEHCASAVAALDMGYHMMLEKPMATTLGECVAIDEARTRNNAIVSVCHSLRHHIGWREIKRLLDADAIGELVSFDLLEGVEPTHQSHSFVRGNWGNEGRSTFMLMAKSCHDVDIIAWLANRPGQRVSSFGSLGHFNEANKPEGATARCTDGCPHNDTCPYSCTRIYLGMIGQTWIASAAKLPDDRAERVEALKTSPYSRCVYQCDNDVVDHQVVAFEFDGGLTGTFTMTAFHPGGRHVRLHGTKGVIDSAVDSCRIRVRTFADGKEQEITVNAQGGGHGGGDDNVMTNLAHAIATGNPDCVPTTTAESLASHRLVFAAELARRERRVVEMSELATAKTLAMPANVV